MEEKKSYLTMTRRELLKHSLLLGASFVIGAGFIAGPDAAWAKEANYLKPETLAKLIQMARDIYPHDKIRDEFYVIAIKGYDSAEKYELVEAGIAELDKLAGGDYLRLGWEQERVAILRKMEDMPFFQTVRGGLVTGLYNQKAVWPVFGYEGESYSKGGYINRGFDEINWI